MTKPHYSTPDNPVYSTVVPVYNSGKPLASLVESLIDIFENKLNESYEILLIDDGSTLDGLMPRLKELSQLEHVRVYSLSRNFGKPGAIVCGLTHSRGRWVITIDDDMQQNPEDILKLVKLRDHDVVTISYSNRHYPSFLRKLTSHIKQLFDRWILGYQVRFSALKLIRRHVVDGMLSISTNKPFIPALIREITTDITAIESEDAPSAYGRSRYSFRRRLSQFSNLLIGNSSFLLQGFSILGCMTALLSFVVGLIILTRKLIGLEVAAGWSSLMVAILFLGGMNLIAIGISGQYFIRILDVSSKKPAFFVKEIWGDSPPKK